MISRELGIRILHELILVFSIALFSFTQTYSTSFRHFFHLIELIIIERHKTLLPLHFLNLSVRPTNIISLGIWVPLPFNFLVRPVEPPENLLFVLAFSPFIVVGMLISEHLACDCGVNGVVVFWGSEITNVGDFVRELGGLLVASNDVSDLFRVRV